MEKGNRKRSNIRKKSEIQNLWRKNKYEKYIKKEFYKKVII